jgi:hypothetical protein
MAGALLGISPGTRVIGLAVIIKGELVEWKVKSFKEKWSKEKCTAILSIISRLIEYYDVTTLSIKKIDPLKSSPQLDSLIVLIEKLAGHRRIAVRKFSLSDLDYANRSGKRDGKVKLTEHIVKKHPELKHEYFKEQNNRREYYIKMFEAIAIAERCRE